MTVQKVDSSFNSEQQAWWQLLLLLLMNLIPLLGVVLMDWDIFTVIFLFWLENGIIGAFNIIKLMMCKGSIGRKLPMALFFVIHYGFFTSAHGILLLGLFQIPFLGDPWLVWPWAMDWLIETTPAVKLAVIAMIGYWLFDCIQFALTEKSIKDPDKQMMEPYSRIVIAHLVLLLGAFVAIKFGGGLPILILLVIIKTLISYQDLKRQNKRQLKPSVAKNAEL
ncbi:DUF6498-containing protein [Kangiella sp. TOML190]|uniref:DUF6498-containing protein n=1 Tax=Kangiella sp. TOML190 TaxID=2931351 RepID=UPI00203C5A0E|nr:DUF6498-containing protein [Kangiella sp. TOML190]